MKTARGRREEVQRNNGPSYRIGEMTLRNGIPIRREGRRGRNLAFIGGTRTWEERGADGDLDADVAEAESLDFGMRWASLTGKALVRTRESSACCTLPGRQGWKLGTIKRKVHRGST